MKCACVVGGWGCRKGKIILLEKLAWKRAFTHRCFVVYSSRLEFSHLLVDTYSAFCDVLSEHSADLNDTKKCDMMKKVIIYNK